MTNEEMILLATIRQKCEDDPSFIAHIVNAFTSGVIEAELKMRRQASDMETAFSAMCFLVGQSRVSPQLKKQMSELALSKLQKYEGKSFLRWDDRIKKDIESGEK
jgi:hypothetical protein